MVWWKDWNENKQISKGKYLKTNRNPKELFFNITLNMLDCFKWSILPVEYGNNLPLSKLHLDPFCFGSKENEQSRVCFTGIYWLFQKVTIAFVHKTKESQHWLELKHSLESEYNTDEQHVLNPWSSSSNTFCK